MVDGSVRDGVPLHVAEAVRGVGRDIVTVLEQRDQIERGFFPSRTRQGVRDHHETAFGLLARYPNNTTELVEGE